MRKQRRSKYYIVNLESYSCLCFTLFFLADKCRDITFKENFKGMSLRRHVIRTVKSENSDLCEIQCYLEEECVSYNFRKKACDLNKSDHIFHPEDLVKDEDSIYCGTRVSEISV